MFAPLLVVPIALAPQSTPAAAPAPAPAQQRALTSSFSYNYVEAAYFRSNLDNVKSDAEGWGIRASYDVIPNVNLIGAFKYQSADILGGDLEITEYIIGVGSHHPIHSKVDAFGTFDFRWQDRDVLGSSDDDTGYGFSGGVRALPRERIELEAAINYSYVVTSNTELALGARGYLSEKLSVGLGYALGDNASTFSLGLRVNI